MPALTCLLPSWKEVLSALGDFPGAFSPVAAPGVTGSWWSDRDGHGLLRLLAQPPGCFRALVRRVGSVSLSLSFEDYFRDNKRTASLSQRPKMGKLLTQGDVSNTKKDRVHFDKKIK